MKLQAARRRRPAPARPADDVTHNHLLKLALEARGVNHSEAYSRDGVRTNVSESFFSRLRRMIDGQKHKVGVHLDAHAGHMASLEGHRHESNDTLADGLAGRALAAPIRRT